MMFAEKPRIQKWVTLFAVLGFVAFVLYLLLFTDFGKVSIIVGRTNLIVYAFAFL